MLTLNGVNGTCFILNRKVLQCLSNDQGKLNLVVKIDPLRPYNWAFSREQDGSCRLQEEERLFRPGAVELGDMVSERHAVSHLRSTHDRTQAYTYA